MFGTRAGLFVDLSLCVSLLAPWVTSVSLGFARRRSFVVHRNIQLLLLAVGIAAVIAIEVAIRLAGGSLELIGQNSLARGLLAVHVSAAVLTYGLWTWQALVSRKRFGVTLPEQFSGHHRKIGKIIFGGLTFTAVSASAMYLVAFVF